MDDDLVSIPLARFTLPLWRKVLFGLGGFSVGLIRSVLAIFQFAFLLEVVEMQVKWAGFILFTEQIIDAVGDLLIGFLSDNFPTRFGRRKPWIYLMSVPTVIFWVLSWIAPGRFYSQTGLQIFYYLVIYSIFSFCMSCVFIPYQAIIPDIAPTPMQRSIIVVLWQSFLIAGAAIASFFWSSTMLLFPVESGDTYDEGMTDNYRKGSAVAGTIIGFLFLFTTILGASSVLERRELRVRESIQESVKKSLTILNFQPFTILCFLQCFSMLSIATFMENIYLYTKYVIEYEGHSNYLFLTIMVRN